MNRESRIKKAAECGIKSQEDFEKIVDNLATLRLEKVIDYGDSRYKNLELDKDLWMCFSDVNRKTIRLEQLTKSVNKGDTAAMKVLSENYKDLTNYGLMGVQILEQLLKSKKAPAIQVTQIAIYNENPRKLIENLKHFGLTDWVEDIVEAEGEVWGKPSRNKAELFFNYQLGNFELEILHYVEGPNWLTSRNLDPLSSSLSHLGVHVEDVEAIKKAMGNIEIAQEVFTKSHSNPAIKDIRSYQYVIFNTWKIFGFDFKIIKRIDKND